MGDPAVPGPGLDFAGAALRAAGGLAGQNATGRAGAALGAVWAQQGSVCLWAERGFITHRAANPIV